MAPSSKEGQPPLVDRILQIGKLAYNPELPEDDREQGQREFGELTERYVYFSNIQLVC
jgi:hypothetical protein